MRSLQLFLSKLKDMKLIYMREVSEINKNVAKESAHTVWIRVFLKSAKEPVEASEVLELLNKR